MDMNLIDLFEFTEGEQSMKRFFESYLETRNEVKSLLELGLTFTDLTNWKQNKVKYFDIKQSLDEYFVTEIEDACFSRALNGDFKSAEMILKNRSANYNSKLVEDDDEVNTTEALIQAVLDGNDEDNE